MSNDRRARLRGAVEKLSEVSAVVRAVCDKEEDCLDNIPENLRDTERYECMEQAADSLNEALELLDEADEHIRSAIGG